MIALDSAGSGAIFLRKGLPCPDLPCPDLLPGWCNGWSAQARLMLLVRELGVWLCLLRVAAEGW